MWYKVVCGYNYSFIIEARRCKVKVVLRIAAIRFTCVNSCCAFISALAVSKSCLSGRHSDKICSG